MTEETRPRSRSSSLHRWTVALVVILTVLAAVTLIAQLYHVAAYFGDVISLYFAAWILQFLFAPQGSATVAWAVAPRPASSMPGCSCCWWAC
jgi:hypothetical protein